MTEIQRFVEAYETVQYVLSAGRDASVEPDFLVDGVLVERGAVMIGDERS